MRLLTLLALTLALAPAAEAAAGKAETRAAERARAQSSWRKFFADFRAGVRRRDRAALRGMMAADFLYSFGGNGDRDEAFAYWDQAGADG